MAVVSSQENSAPGASLPSLIPFSVLTKCEVDVSSDDANMDKTRGPCKTIDVKIEEELEVTEVTTEDEVYDQYVIVDQSDEYKVIPIQQEVTNNTPPPPPLHSCRPCYILTAMQTFILNTYEI